MLKSDTIGFSALARGSDLLVNRTRFSGKFLLLSLNFEDAYHGVYILTRKTFDLGYHLSPIFGSVNPLQIKEEYIKLNLRYDL